MAKIGLSVTAIACLALAFLLLFSATRASAAASVVDEKRTCYTQSHRFKGKCFSDRNCKSVCQTERFNGGSCRGFRQRCFCTRGC